jgi:hypothetical protein
MSRVAFACYMLLVVVAVLMLAAYSQGTCQL